MIFPDDVCQLFMSAGRWPSQFKRGVEANLDRRRRRRASRGYMLPLFPHRQRVSRGECQPKVEGRHACARGHTLSPHFCFYADEVEIFRGKAKIDGKRKDCIRCHMIKGTYPRASTVLFSLIALTSRDRQNYDDDKEHLNYPKGERYHEVYSAEFFEICRSERSMPHTRADGVQS